MFPLYIYPAEMPKEERRNTPDNLSRHRSGKYSPKTGMS